MLPLFTSHFSLNSSILTLEPAEEIKDNSPVSVFSIAKKHDLKDIFLVEKSMTGFLQATNSAKKSDVNLRFGIKLTMVANQETKDEESFKTEHNIIVWLLNSEGYPDLCKLVTSANTNGFYYIPRIDESYLSKYLTPNLAVSIPFYGSFLANNLLKFSTCLFNYERFNPTFFKEKSNLPFDPIIQRGIDKLKVGAEEVRSIYYYLKKDFPAFMTMKCIGGGPGRKATWDSPNQEHFASREFCFESYLEQGK